MDIYNKIYPLPPLPKQIVEAVNRDELAVFVGAGVSRLVGCWGWDKLATELVEQCCSSKKDNGSFCLNYKQKEMLLANRDHKKTITICHHILKDEGLEETFFTVLEQAIEGNSNLANSRNIYDELYGLRGLFITTNVDQHFDKHFEPQKIIYGAPNFSPDNIDRTNLYHIHGSILDRSSLVFRVPDYINLYKNQRFQEFLKTIFNEKVVLFTGYGLSEFELLDFLMTKFDSSQQTELKHFILQPYFRGDENILQLEQYYYNKMGIAVIGYEKDEKGYSQLCEVIKDWNREINQVSSYTCDSFIEIDKLMSNYAK